MIRPDELEQALMVIRLKLSELEVRHQQRQLPSLVDRDWCWEEWSLHIESLARLLRGDERPDSNKLAVLVANAVAFLIVLDRAEVVDPASGREAA